MAIELKVGDFKPEYAGKMQFYLSALNDLEKMTHENPSIGIIVCKTKSRTVVEYALKDAGKPIGVATYRMSKSLPRTLSRYLPSAREWTQGLEVLSGGDHKV